MVAIEYAKLKAEKNHESFAEIMEQYFALNDMPSPKLPKKNKGKSHKKAKTAPKSSTQNAQDASTSPTRPEQIIQTLLPFSPSTPPSSSYDPLLGSINQINISPPPPNNTLLENPANSCSLSLHLSPSNNNNSTTETSNIHEKVNFNLGSIANIATAQSPQCSPTVNFNLGSIANTVTPATPSPFNSANAQDTPQCSTADSDINSNASLTSEDTIIDIDIDKDNELQSVITSSPAHTRSPYVLRKQTCTFKTPSGSVTMHKSQ